MHVHQLSHVLIPLHTMNNAANNPTTHQVHEELPHPLVHDLVVLPSSLHLLQKELVVVVAKGREHNACKVILDSLQTG